MKTESLTDNMNLSFTKIIPSDPSLIPEVDQFILEKINTVNFNSELISNISLALSEGLANAIVHGNKLDPNKNVTISVNLFDDRLVISIKDEGNGFNPDEVPDPTRPENILRDSGRGIHIMKSFINNVSYKFDNNGTELILVINISKEENK
jgi:serine/threonine-protein kinase RsbW